MIQISDCVFADIDENTVKFVDGEWYIVQDLDEWLRAFHAECERIIAIAKHADTYDIEKAAFFNLT